MRTLHVDTGRKMGGGQWQALYLVERMPGAVLLAAAKSPLLAEALARGLDAAEFSVAAMWKAARNVELIHAHDARAHTFAAAVGGARIIVSRRVAFPVKTSLASRWKYRRADRYLAVSEFVAAQLRDASVPPDKIRVVYDGVPIALETSRQPGRVVALASKGIEIPGIPIHFSTDLWHDLSTASVFVYVSELEGLGSAALAAQAAGVPVVATRAGGLAEAVEHECTGLVVGRHQLAASVQRLLDDPAFAAEMGRRGRERVKQTFSVEAMVERSLRAYEEVLA